MTNYILKFVLIIGLIIPIVALGNNRELKRHIYFGSSCLSKGGTTNCEGWKISIKGGKLHITDCDVDEGRGPCKITDGMEIIYAGEHNYGFDDGNPNQVTIEDLKGKLENFIFYYNSSSLIHKQDTTGNIYLNEPSYGDITINSAEW